MRLLHYIFSIEGHAHGAICQPYMHRKEHGLHGVTIVWIGRDAFVPMAAIWSATLTLPNGVICTGVHLIP